MELPVVAMRSVDYFNGELPSGGARVMKEEHGGNAVEDVVRDVTKGLILTILFADGRERIAADFDEFGTEARRRD